LYRGHTSIVELMAMRDCKKVWKREEYHIQHTRQDERKVTENRFCLAFLLPQMLGERNPGWKSAFTFSSTLLLSTNTLFLVPNHLDRGKERTASYTHTHNYIVTPSRQLTKHKHT
jgi:hypothetical protein